ncbi:hypothetical protein FBD94_15425 [Pedobacter hiemivivus]|uniref:DUF4168 domain-containing protein n=1 Tax=Pedobacter hiemivivus TaxID=2530454 RepID=A0A4U1G9Q7_9SPHI|nr:hypothetical protein [Pedobacter hiemivivus]TKC60294.1 hypothetical protein FBD94_15425 [Pedobacter hiemivivus]
MTMKSTLFCFKTFSVTSIFFLFVFVNTTSVKAQVLKSMGGSESFQIKRVEYFSQQMGVSIEEAKKVIALMDRSTEGLNQIYNDSTLSQPEKIKRLSVIRKDTDSKIKVFVPDFESRLKKATKANSRNFKKQK